ncbi:MAG: OmpH family outer membrane protein [Gemmataceae bacterium]|nr:OmpH family outer membrane protein [Gemmataceae bacterium]
MSKASPSAVERNGTVPQHSNSVSQDQELHAELERLAAINEELLGSAKVNGHSFANDEELARKRADNTDLLLRVQELEALLQAAATNEEAWLERQKEFEAILEEKSEVIRTLHLKIQEKHVEKPREEPPVSDEVAKAAALDKEVQRLRRELQAQKEQLAEDEESLMAQMRQMEMSMAKDRAELARQRNDIQRLQSEFNHEMEMASRDPGLRERLASFQRRHKDTGAHRRPVLPAAAADAKVPPAPQPQPPQPKKPQSSGLIKRLFGG